MSCKLTVVCSCCLSNIHCCWTVLSEQSCFTCPSTWFLLGHLPLQTENIVNCSRHQCLVTAAFSHCTNIVRTYILTCWCQFWPLHCCLPLPPILPVPESMPMCLGIKYCSVVCLLSWWSMLWWSSSLSLQLPLTKDVSQVTHVSPVNQRSSHYDDSLFNAPLEHSVDRFWRFLHCGPKTNFVILIFWITPSKINKF